MFCFGFVAILLVFLSFQQTLFQIIIRLLIKDDLLKNKVHGSLIILFPLDYKFSIFQLKLILNSIFKHFFFFSKNFLKLSVWKVFLITGIWQFFASIFFIPLLRNSEKQRFISSNMCTKIEKSKKNQIKIKRR